MSCTSLLLARAPNTSSSQQFPRDLSRLANAVNAELIGNQGSAGDVFLRLCRECASTNDELQGILDKLKAQGSTKIALAADGWRIAFRQVAAAGDIERLADRLTQIRQQMNVTLLYLLLLVNAPPFIDMTRSEQRTN